MAGERHLSEGWLFETGWQSQEKRPDCLVEGGGRACPPFPVPFFHNFPANLECRVATAVSYLSFFSTSSFVFASAGAITRDEHRELLPSFEENWRERNHSSAEIRSGDAALI
jgi:hypothetical protein